MIQTARWAALLAAALMIPAVAAARDLPEGLAVEKVFEGSETILGQPVTFPAEDPGVLAYRLTVQPGAETGWHIHEAPIFAHVLEGEITVDYGADGERTYKAGEAILEALETPHNGRNSGDVPTVIMVLYLTGDGNAPSVPADPPAN